MSTFTQTESNTNDNQDLTGANRRHEASNRRISTETKASYKTTELIAYVAAVIGVLVASAMVDASDFGAQEAWFYVTLLTIGYMVSRGLAKAGSYEKEHHTTGDSGQ
jgi:hypothetical protein